MKNSRLALFGALFCLTLGAYAAPVDTAVTVHMYIQAPLIQPADVHQLKIQSSSCPLPSYSEFSANKGLLTFTLKAPCRIVLAGPAVKGGPIPKMTVAITPIPRSPVTKMRVSSTCYPISPDGQTYSTGYVVSETGNTPIVYVKQSACVAA